jgi:hypothetical protein
LLVEFDQKHLCLGLLLVSGTEDMVLRKKGNSNFFSPKESDGIKMHFDKNMRKWLCRAM